jgi:hypothetical protein
MGGYFRRWQGRYKICDSFTVSLAVPKKLHSEMPIFAPANYRYFHGQGSWFLRNSNSQCEIGSRIQCDVAAYSAASGRKVDQDSFSGADIALDIRRIADWNSQATSWLHRHNNLRDERATSIGGSKENFILGLAGC